MSYDMDDKSGDAVRVMTRGETEDYSGVTLEAEGNPKLDDEKKDSSFNIKIFSLNSMSIGQKILTLIGGIVFFALAFVAFIPLVIILLIALLFGFLFRRQTMVNLWEKGKTLLNFWRNV